MPIQFTQTTPQGVTVSYNVIQSNNFIGGVSQVQLVSYVSQASFANGDAPFPGQGFTFPGELTNAQAETTIIALPEWSGATQVS